MRLISCYIENFGGLQKFSYDFKTGLNVILEGNGWGKTTLAAFLKAMFYGMERTTKRSLEENERKKYEPWNGGIYGGNLVFETDGLCYRIERFFGIKDKEDSFVLYDEATGLVSRAYTERIGEELFGIDRGAFEQSVFMKQGMYSVSMTDSVATKLSGLMASGDDVDCYEKACLRIENEMKIYKKTGNRGKIAELAEELSLLSRKIADGKQIAAAMPEWKKKEEQYQKDLETEYARKDKLKERMLTAGKQAALKERQKYYKALEEEIIALEQQMEELDRFFGNGAPEAEELECYRNKMFQYKSTDEVLPETKVSFRYPELAERMEVKAMTEEELDACEHRWNVLSEKLILLNKKSVRLQALQLHEEEQKEACRDRAKSIAKKQMLSLVCALIALVGSVVFYFFLRKYVYIGVVFLVVFVSLYIFLAIRKRKVSNEMEQDNPELANLETDNTELEEEISRGQKAIRSYLEEYYGRAGEDIPSMIGRLRITLFELKSHNDLKQQFLIKREKQEKETEETGKEILAFLQRFYGDEAKIDEELLKDLEKKRTQYAQLVMLHNEKCDKLAKTEKVELNYEDEHLSMDELQEQERRLDGNIVEKERELNRIRRTITDYEEVLEECEKLEMEKSDLEELLAEYNDRYRILEKTLKYLKAAQNDFSSRYLKKMNDGFGKYAELFRKDMSGHPALDVKLNIKTEEDGMKRDLGYYSKGIRETMELSARFALVEALFEKETPFVVLDDPFVNLDSCSLEGAKKVLETIAEQYQLIYFTCHPSRQ